MPGRMNYFLKNTPEYISTYLQQHVPVIIVAYSNRRYCNIFYTIIPEMDVTPQLTIRENRLKPVETKTVLTVFFLSRIKPRFPVFGFPSRCRPLTRTHVSCDAKIACIPVPAPSDTCFFSLMEGVSAHGGGI